MSLAEPTVAITSSGLSPLPVILPWPLVVDEARFAALVAANPEVPLEQNSQGEVLLMSPTGSEGGRRNNEIAYQLTVWNKQTKMGEVFDSSTLFRLSNGAARSPDATWVEKSRWEALSIEEQEGIARLTPDFVIELRSRTDTLEALQAKMDEYLSCGVSLGWLIDPVEKTVHIYVAGAAPVVLHNPATVAGSGPVAGFTLETAQIFS